MAILERPDFVATWRLPSSTRIKRATHFDGHVQVFDPPVQPRRIQLQHDDDFTVVEIETLD